MPQVRGKRLESCLKDAQQHTVESEKLLSARGADKYVNSSLARVSSSADTFKQKKKKKKDNSLPEDNIPFLFTTLNNAKISGWTQATHSSFFRHSGATPLYATLCCHVPRLNAHFNCSFFFDHPRLLMLHALKLAFPFELFDLFLSRTNDVVADKKIQSYVERVGFFSILRLDCFLDFPPPLFFFLLTWFLFL